MSKQLSRLEAWKNLRCEWQPANSQARAAREVLTTAFQRALESGGTPPKEALLHECQKLERTTAFLGTPCIQSYNRQQLSRIRVATAVSPRLLSARPVRAFFLFEI